MRLRSSSRSSFSCIARLMSRFALIFPPVSPSSTFVGTSPRGGQDILQIQRWPLYLGATCVSCVSVVPGQARRGPPVLTVDFHTSFLYEPSLNQCRLGSYLPLSRPSPRRLPTARQKRAHPHARAAGPD